jgi:hypothetical protein
MNEQPTDAYDNHARALRGKHSNGHMPVLAGEVAEFGRSKPVSIKFPVIACFVFGFLVMLVLKAI